MVKRCVLPKNYPKKRIGNGLWGIEWSYMIRYEKINKKKKLKQTNTRQCPFNSVQVKIRVGSPEGESLTRKVNVVTPIRLGRNISKTMGIDVRLQ